MKLSKLASAVAVGLALASGGAMADPFYIDMDSTAIGGTALSGNGQTALADEIQVNWKATSIYNDTIANGVVDVGETVTDSGAGTVGGFLLAGSNLSFAQTQGYGNPLNWGTLTFNYTGLTGTVLAVIGSGIGAKYTSGDIKVYAANSNHLLTLSVFDSDGTIANANIYTHVTFAAPNTWYYPPSTDWSTLVVGLKINGIIDTNVNGPLPTGPVGGQLQRTSTLNGSISFNAVPEPGSIALIGLGLLGLGLSYRNKKTKTA